MQDNKQRTFNGVPYSLVGHTHTISELVGRSATRAYVTTSYNNVANIVAKVNLLSEDYDINSNWNNVASRFTASYTGIYHVTCNCKFTSASAGRLVIYKNSTEYFRVYEDTQTTLQFNGATDIQLNSGEYIEMWVMTTALRTIQAISTAMCVHSI